MHLAGEPRFEDIRPRTKRLGRVIVHVATTESTMTEARQAAVSGEPDGLVVVADEQTGGVGRRGRSWYSPRGNLHATVVLRPNFPAENLTWVPLAAGAAMAEAIERLIGVRALVKWPNDVLIDGRKVAGVLTETRWSSEGHPDWVLVGVGVNGDRRTEEFPAELRERATSLSMAAGRHVCLPALLKIFLERLEAFVDALAGSVEDVRSRVEARMVTRGQRVRVTTEHAVIEGVASWLGPRGELVLETEDGVRTIEAGECELLRPAAG